MRSSRIALLKEIELLCHRFFSMQLMMYIGNDLIEAIPLNLSKISEPGYLGSFKRSLKMKYSELIQEMPHRPEFLVINPNPPQEYFCS